MKAKRRYKFFFTFATILLVLLGFYQFGRSLWMPIYLEILGRRSVESISQELSPKTELILKPAFKKVGLAYPPKKLALLGFKEEKKLEIWAKNQDKWVYVTTYEIKAASGKPGPKLKEGDRQVPEGIYRIVGLNPNSSFHLSMKINYPNDFDFYHAKLDKRQNLGGDIFIHGKAVSIGCLAMGDEAAEQLFILVNLIGMKNVSVIIAPRDFRRNGIKMGTNPSSNWLPELYSKINYELKNFAVN